MKCIVKQKLSTLLLLLVTVMAMLITLSSVSTVDAKEPGALSKISSIYMSGSDVAPVLVVSASSAITYTSYKSGSPSRLVIDFSQAVPSEAVIGSSLSQGPVKAVSVKQYDTEAGVLTRIEIFLSQNIDPVITPSSENNWELKVSFPGFVPEQPKTAVSGNLPAATATVPTVANDSSVAEPKSNATPTADIVISEIKVVDNSVDIIASATPVDFKYMRLSKPDRFVVDINGAKTTIVNKLISLNVKEVSSVRVGVYSDKIRLVFDVTNSGLVDPVIEKTLNGLRLIFSGKQVEAPNVDVSSDTMKSKLLEAPVAPVLQANSNKESASNKAITAKQTNDVFKPVKPRSQTVQVEAVDFQALDGVSRVTIKGIGVDSSEPIKSSKSVVVKINNATISKQLQRSLDTSRFVTPVSRVTPVLVNEKKQSAVLIKIALKMNTTIKLVKEENVLHLEIKHPDNLKNIIKNGLVDSSTQKAASSVISDVSVVDISPVQQVVTANEDKLSSSEKHRFVGRKVTLEFADAEVRKIFQLLSEVSGKNFVLGDEVAGNISLKLVNVPWDQALEVIMETKGLDKREDGSIVLIRGRGKFKSQMDEEVEIHKAKQKSEPLVTEVFDVNYASLTDIVNQFKAVATDRGIINKDDRTNKIIVKDIKNVLVDMRSLLKTLDLPERQVVIEARIVEAQTSFTRSLGVNWGMHYRDGSASMLGINSMDTTFGGITSSPATTGVAATAGGAAGISFGTLSNNIKLDLRMSAAVTAGMLKIVSTPRIATLNNKQAKISQGYEVPYQTIDDKGNPKVEFKKVDLLLEVTPNINPNGTVNLKVNAKNNNIVPGSTAASGVAITTKEASTEMLLKDGDTTVIGGIFVDTENDTEDGVPFLNELPFIGGLFKSSEKKKIRNELLIFITPRIMNIN